MQESGMIEAYTESLAGKLNFNPSLSQRVRQEIQDHLWEAAAADPSGNGREAVQHAIANFGDPHVIAAQFATAWLARQTWKVGVTIILVITSVFVAMKARVTWYAAAQWILSDHVRAVAKIVGLIDACAFYVSVILGIAGCVYVIVRRAPTTALCASHCSRLRHLLLLSAVSAAALSVSVIGDGVLTALRVVGREFTVEFVVPIFSIAIEIVCAGILIFSVRSIVVRMVHTAALLKA
ncbi:hypothetical protein [Bradyrhizobium lablabi]|uniref:hypothetical protein n=1 Tax=Bradyrhizobium lablabi TaxID=722472 RepID=UPI001BA826B1|nr:hypothetical protein [Bradyrhizobium lablabi]MBR0696497.1 hypothetical protein [Bradyrhizobium lablabi]